MIEKCPVIRAGFHPRLSVDTIDHGGAEAQVFAMPRLISLILQFPALTWL